MGLYAVLKDTKVINLIVADSLAIAETASESTCVEYTRDTPISIGWTYDGTTFFPPKPYPSWIWNSTTFSWNAPESEPIDSNNYTWNEKDGVWDIVTTIP